MESPNSSRLLMLGAAPETRGSIAAVVEACRAHGLFRRWPIEYIATHGDGPRVERLGLAWRALRRFGELLARERRLTVHLHTAAAGNFWRDLPFMLATLAAGRPLLLQLHGAGFERFYDSCDSMARTLIRSVLNRAAVVIVATDSRRSWVRSICRNANAVAVPNPVDVIPSSSAPQQRNMILFLGKLKQSKGIFDLLQAVAGLRATVPDVRLVCAGDGERIAVARYAERLGIADAVKFTGWVGPSGKRALLENAAVFALPSYDEALPMSLLEAMGAGVPVIASPVGGVHEAVVDGVSGFLVASGDTHTLERLLGQLLQDRLLAARVGAAGRESVRSRYSPDRAVPRIEALYAATGLPRLAVAPVASPELKKAA
jgi:glycosyltransferase involved in cell wall biosynthesis